MKDLNMKSKISARVRATRLTTASLCAVAGISVLTSSPASAHQFCDAETEFSYNDAGQISQATSLYTQLSDLGEAEGAEDNLCQVRTVVDCQNDDGYGVVLLGNWSNGNSSIQAAECPASFPTIIGGGHQTAYDGDILPA